MSRNPSLAAVLNAFRASLLADVRVSVPARVERYDATTQLIDAKPLLRDTFTEEDGSQSVLSLPVITNVPVVFPGAGGFRLTFPVTVGDTVLLVFADRSIDAWLANGGETSPTDERHHHLSDAIAIPGLHPNNAPWSGAEAGVVTLGSDGGAAEFVATADRVLERLNNIATAFNAHVHASSGAPPTPVPGVIPLATTLTGLTAPASSTVKIKG